VLQKTERGVWKDWIWPPYGGGGSQRLTAKPAADGTWSMTYLVPNSAATIHLRVRSAGGTVFSNSVYVTPWSDHPDYPCGG
jgi:hypothetical protein